MTDQNPVPTTRMPIPNEPLGDESSQAGETSPAASDPTAHANDADRGATPPPAEPATFPPVPPVPPMPERPRREDRDAGRTASVLFGMVILGLGLWFFAEHTLGYELPRISWSQLWPVTLILIGLWVVLGSMRRGSR
jgi:uncharacterized membrane protein